VTPQHRPDATADLTAALHERVLVLDGAMGTMIQAYGLSEADYRGERFADHGSDQQGNNDLLSLTQPELIREVHRKYLEAGADLLETNTFGANRFKLAMHGLESRVREINRAGARLARGRVLEDRRELALQLPGVEEGCPINEGDQVLEGEVSEGFGSQKGGAVDGD